MSTDLSRSHQSGSSNSEADSSLVTEFVAVVSEAVVRLEQSTPRDWCSEVAGLLMRVERLRNSLRWGTEPAYLLVRFDRLSPDECVCSPHSYESYLRTWSKDAVRVDVYLASDPLLDRGAEGIVYKRFQGGAAMDNRDKSRLEAIRWLKQWKRFAESRVLPRVSVLDDSRRSTIGESQCESEDATAGPQPPPAYEAGSTDWVLSSELGRLLHIRSSTMATYRRPKECEVDAEDEHGRWGVNCVGAFRRNVNGNKLVAFFVPRLKPTYASKYAHAKKEAQSVLANNASDV